MKKLGLILLGIVMAFIVLEILVRLFFDYEYYDPNLIQSQSIMYSRNSITGIVPLPNQNISLSNVWGSGYDANYRFNNLAYRGDDFDIEKAPNTLRFLVLGGSSAFDILSLHNRDWPHLLEADIQNLNENENIQLISAAVPGYATYNSFGRLSSEAWMLEPDYILIYHCWNDIKYFTAVSNEESLLQARELDMSALWAEYQQTHYTSPIDEFFGLSHIYLRLRRGILPAEEVKENTIISYDLQSDYNQLAVQQYYLNLANLVHFSRQIGAEPILVLEARLVDPSNSENEYDRISYEFVGLNHDGLLAAFDGCDSAMRQLAQEEEVPLIDQTAEMSGNTEYFFDHVHTTPAGSEVLARIIAQAIDSTVLNGR